MAAYAISEVEVLDVARAGRYRELAAEGIARYGGRYLVRGAPPDVPEGERPQVRHLVVVEFPRMHQLRRWYLSPECAEARALRRTALDRRLLCGDGVAD